MKRTFYGILFLLFITTELLAQSGLSNNEDNEDIFIFNHRINRLFNIPTSRIYRSLDFGLTVGSNFNDSGIENFSGSFGFGLFNLVEFQITSNPIDYSNFKHVQNISEISAKINILRERTFLPGISIGGATNLGLFSTKLNETQLKSENETKYDLGLRSVDYDLRINKFYLVMSKRLFSTVNLHLGMSLNQLNFIKINTEYNFGKDNYSVNDLNKRVTEYFGGIDFVLNGRTKFLLEVFSGPLFDLDASNGNIFLKQKTIVNAGMRTFINGWFIVEYGLHFDDQYSKLENIQLRVGLTAFWNIF